MAYNDSFQSPFSDVSMDRTIHSVAIDKFWNQIRM